MERVIINKKKYDRTDGLQWAIEGLRVFKGEVHNGTIFIAQLLVLHS